MSQISGSKTGRFFYTDSTLTQVLLRVLPKFHDRISVLSTNSETKYTSAVTYEKLDNDSSRIATSIRALISRKTNLDRQGDRVIAVCMEPSYELLATLVGIWKIGAAYLPLSWQFPDNRYRHIFNESQPCLILSDRDKTVDDWHFMTFDKLYHEQGDCFDDFQMHIPQPNSVALIVYTSGSTGIPKGVRLTHRNVLNRLEWQAKKLPFDMDENVCVFKTALTFIDSVCEIWAPLFNGLQLLIVSKSDTQNPERLLELLEHFHVRRIVLVPSLLRSLVIYAKMRNKRKEFNSILRIWVCSGEILTKETANEFLQMIEDHSKVTLYNFYGSTEVMGDVSVHKVTENDIVNRSTIPIGQPIDNCTIYLLDQQKQIVPKGSVGEIFVAGENVTIGYVKGRDQDKFYRNSFADGNDDNNDDDNRVLYCTGDYGSISADGLLMYEGRTDSQVKIRGHRVDLSEIQQLLQTTFSNIVDQVLVLVNPKNDNPEIYAFIKLRTGESQIPIESGIKQILPPYMVPRLKFVKEFPLLINGKIDRQTLLKSLKPNSKLLCDYGDYEGHQLEICKALYDILQTEVLIGSNLQTLHSKLNFFEIGGNSLNSILTINALFEKGYYIGIGDFLHANSLAAIVEKTIVQSDLNNNEICSTDCLIMKSFSSEPLCDRHQEEAINIITKSFYEKADLEHWLMPEINENDYVELMEAVWESLLEKNLSFAVFKNGDEENSNKMIGVALNFDVHDEPQIKIESKLNVVFDFLEHLEGPIRDQHLPKERGQVLHSLMMGTDASLSAQDNVAVIQFMEQKSIELCKSRGFNALFTTNTNPLTQQLGLNVFHYKCLLDYQVNEYEVDGWRPFGDAPDSQRAIVCYKQLL